MSTYLNGHANAALAFDTLDFLVGKGITPTIELGLMPEALASDPSLTTFHYKGGISAPADPMALGAFITELVQLFVDRYTLATVQTWKFEVWNEPNCGFYYVGGCCGPDCGNQTAYFSLYETVARAVKAVDASLPVGGPATAQLGWIPEFLAFVQDNDVPADFVTSHLYPTDPGFPASRDGFLDSVAGAALASAQGGLPFLLTEFNAGLGNEDGVPLLDSAYTGGFLLHAHLLAQGAANLASMSYWTFTDFGFEEAGVDPLPWNPGQVTPTPSPSP
jgi:xylan 1,4-beta-xylosidase